MADICNTITAVPDRHCRYFISVYNGLSAVIRLVVSIFLYIFQLDSRKIVKNHEIIIGTLTNSEKVGKI